MSASGGRREDKRNIEDENYSASLGQKIVAVEAVAHRSVQQVLLQKVCGRASSGCQTNEISCRRMAAGVPSRARGACRQAMSVEE